MKTIRMEDMNWPDIRKAVSDGFTTVVVGIGSTEQHGPHLPTGTDTLIGDAVACRVASKLGDALQARTIAVGCSEHHLSLAGTLSLRHETLKMILHDYVDSLSKHGFTRIVLLPSHGGNFATVKEVVAELGGRYPHLQILGYTDLMAFIDVLVRASARFGVSQEASGAHAGENETSIVLALARELVATDRFAPGYLGPLGEKEVELILARGISAVTESGVLGDPTKAAADRGHVYLETLADFLVEQIRRDSA